MKGKPIIEAVDLTKKFGNFTAVDKITFSIEEGNVVGFIGANGAGKTTTIKMMCGLVRPTAGSVRVDGRDVGSNPSAIRQLIGYMSQKFSLYGDLTVRENIEFYGGIYNLSGEEFKKRYEWVINAADLNGKESLLTRDLPLGWRQRLALGCAVLHRPRIVFLDEPTSGVDPILRSRFWQLIGDLSREGATIIVTTHYLDEAEFCESVIMMHAGKIVVHGSPAEIRARYSNLPLFEVTCKSPEKVLSILEGEKWISEATIIGDKVHIYGNTDDCEERLSKLLAKACHDDFLIQKTNPTLEDVFIKVTRFS
ncbi:MAG: ATP-binding cassette domain-containing protein [Candidatus Kryptoniota bacterium]